eukprot:9503611-Pyramimonas_sp.AAC.1
MDGPSAAGGQGHVYCLYTPPPVTLVREVLLRRTDSRLVELLLEGVERVESQIREGRSAVKVAPTAKIYVWLDIFAVSQHVTGDIATHPDFKFDQVSFFILLDSYQRLQQRTYYSAYRTSTIVSSVDLAELLGTYSSRIAPTNAS